MNTNAIRDVATRARRQLMEAVERRCLLFGIEEGVQGEANTVNGRVLSAAERAQRRELLRIQDDLRGDGKPGSGHAALVEQAAYTWFNRLFAIRFMELNDRLPSHVRMLSAQDGSFAPECLREAMDLPLETLDREEAARLVAEGDDEGLFRLILLAQCAELAACMPAVFERVGSAMELLLPDGLLAKDGIVESLVTGIPEDDWREGVEIVGWAYQYYVAERKAEYKRAKRKAGRDDIAPATQLFTPEYIVRFLVQNSLGRLWVLNNPSSLLADQMEYFVKPDPESHEEFRRVSSPEEITLIDPACGSGHFLCYAFDLLARMYEERGYRGRDIARLILEKNLTGIEIDRRAAALTSFALTMKACERDSRFLRRSISPKVICIESVELTLEEREAVGAGPEQQELVELLAHLSEVGSLWQPTLEDIKIINKWSELAVGTGLFAATAAEKISRVQEYVQVLKDSRLVCATNPPYLPKGDLLPWMSSWVTSHYPEEKTDLCTCFIARGFTLLNGDGYNAQVTMHSWMSLSSYENMRKEVLSNRAITAMAHLGTRAFDAIGGEVVATTATVFHCSNDVGKACYFRLTGIAGEAEKDRALLSAIANPASHLRFIVCQDDLKIIASWPVSSYWVSNSVRLMFRDNPISSKYAAKEGVGTRNDDVFLKLFWEVSARKIGKGRRWILTDKAGAYRKWYMGQTYVMDWENDGYRIKNYRNPDGSLRSRPQNLGYLYLPGVSWGKVGTGDPSFRVRGEGFGFNDAAPTLFGGDLYSIAGFLNSSVMRELMRIQGDTINLTTGVIGGLPLPKLTGVKETVDSIVLSSVDACKRDWDSFETSWDFSKHPLVRGNRISSTYGLWSAECKDRFDTLKNNEEQLNTIFARIYSMEGEVPIEVEDDKVSVRRADLGRDVRSLISYAVGCMFGRYSLDRPGLVLANQGDGLDEYFAQVPHPRYTPDDDGILPITDDEYFEDDIVSMFCEFLKAAYGPETLEENLQFVADALEGTGSARQIVRNYFMNRFYVEHCATYSFATSGKRPIYWLIDSGKLGGFRALVYMHRYTPDLLARVRTDYVHERQERYRSRIAELEREREGASRREQSAIDKELKRLRAQLDEVTKFEERLHHLADQMIEIDLDDGFKVNYAKFADVMAKVK